MQDIRKNIISWNTYTYNELLTKNSFFEESVKQETKKVLKQLNILDKSVCGYTCENLPKTEESRLAITKTYSEMFHEEMKTEEGSPLGYICRIVSECLNYSIGSEKIVGAVARGLRTLSSLLREPDFAQQLHDVMTASDPDVFTNLNSKQDSSDHTDVLLHFKNKDYRIWLYQFSTRGLPHDIERMSGKRGELPNGTHIICPLHTECAIDYERLCDKEENLIKKIEKQKSNLFVCTERAKKKKQLLSKKLDDLQEALAITESELTKAKEITEEELNIVCGWYLYSNSYVKRVAQYIENLHTPEDYSKVLTMLTGPEKFIGQINSFSKGDEK